MKELVPLLVQGLVMSVDEFYCHQRRTLNLWERVGHPADTLVFLLCFAYISVVPAQSPHLGIYAGLSVLSCLMISKDEWQHQELCSGFENWLHSLLFILHPVVLIWTGFLWWTQNPSFRFVNSAGMTMIALFFIYQVVFWNVLKPWSEQKAKNDQ